MKDTVVFKNSFKLRKEIIQNKDFEKLAIFLDLIDKSKNLCSYFQKKAQKKKTSNLKDFFESLETYSKYLFQLEHNFNEFRRTVSKLLKNEAQNHNLSTLSVQKKKDDLYLFNKWKEYFDALSREEQFLKIVLDNYDIWILEVKKNKRNRIAKGVTLLAGSVILFKTLLGFTQSAPVNSPQSVPKVFVQNANDFKFKADFVNVSRETKQLISSAKDNLTKYSAFFLDAVKYSYKNEVELMQKKENLLYLSRLLYGEAENCDNDERSRICDVVFERVKSRSFPNTIKEVAIQPRQFSCFNTFDPNYKKINNTDNIKNILRKRAFEECFRVAKLKLDSLYDGSWKPTGAVFYRTRSSYEKEKVYFEKINFLRQLIQNENNFDIRNRLQKEYNLNFDQRRYHAANWWMGLKVVSNKRAHIFLRP